VREQDGDLALSDSVHLRMHRGVMVQHAQSLGTRRMVESTEFLHAGSSAASYPCSTICKTHVAESRGQDAVHVGGDRTQLYSCEARRRGQSVTIGHTVKHSRAQTNQPGKYICPQAQGFIHALQ
jgi:hypothetical protein